MGEEEGSSRGCTGHEGHEGNEGYEGHEEGDEGYEGNESHEGHEEGHEGNEGYEGHEGNEEVSACSFKHSARRDPCRLRHVGLCCFGEVCTGCEEDKGSAVISE